MNVLIDENNPFIKEVLSNYTFINNIKTFNGRNLNNQILLDSNCEVIFCRSTSKIDEKLLKNSNVSFLATVTSGIDHIDLTAIKKYKIKFVDALGSNSNGVAEFVLFSVLDWLNKNNKIEADYSHFKIGIIGFGNVGKKVAFYAHKLGFEIYVNDPPLKNNNFEFPNYIKYKELDGILDTCDIITNHVPLEKVTFFQNGETSCNYSKNNTYKLLSENLVKLKQSCCFIHSSRGSVVDEEKIIELRKNNNISFYFDVWDNEPSINKQLKLITEISTPHIAGHTINSKINGVKVVLQEFDKYINEKYNIMLNSMEILDKTLSKNLELNNNINNLINFNINNINYLSSKFKINLYKSLKQNRKFYELSQNIKNNDLLEDTNNNEFDKYRKEYNCYETISF
jgi:erythronate-4-phosphate dehydrogenase